MCSKYCWSKWSYQTHAEYSACESDSKICTTGGSRITMTWQWSASNFLHQGSPWNWKIRTSSPSNSQANLAILPWNPQKLFETFPKWSHAFFGSMQHHLSWRVRLLSEASNNLVPPRLVGKPTPSRTCGKIHIYLQSKSSWRTSSYLHLGTLSCKTAYPTPGLLACNTGTSKERY